MTEHAKQRLKHGRDPSSTDGGAEGGVRCFLLKRPNLTKSIAPKELAVRWQRSRSSVDRIARQLGLTQVCPGEDRNGMMRCLREEVDRKEDERQV